MSEIKPFLCDTLDKAIIRDEWKKWIRSFDLYLQAEEISDVVKRRNKLLHLGGPQLQEVAYNLPDCLVEYDTATKNDVYKSCVEALTIHFAPIRNSTFERHLFRSLKPDPNEEFNHFVVKLRQQVSRCELGKSENEIKEIYLKDKIIESWASAELKNRFLEKEHSLEEVLAACSAYQQMKIQTETMSGSSTVNDSLLVNRIVKKKFNYKDNSDAKYNDSSSSQSIRGSLECYRCGSKAHLGNDVKCPARNVRCNLCNLIGHFARKCRSSKDGWSGEKKI